jgi:regulator of sigma E protease
MPAYLAPLFSSVWSVLAVILFFGGSIFVHELGHFLAARRRGLKVERFSIGFGPAIWKRTGRDGVEYRLSCIPLGGYVSLPQLADMRQLEGRADVTEQDRMSIPFLAKFEVLVAGAVFNVIFALLLACLVWWTGYPGTSGDQTTRIGYVAEKITLEDGQEVPGPAANLLRIGDEIRAVDGQPVRRWRDVQTNVMLGAGRTADNRPAVDLTIQRDGAVQTLNLLPVRIGFDQVRTLGIDSADDVLVGAIMEDSPAAATSLALGDHLLALNGQPIYGAGHVIEWIGRNQGAPVTLTVARGEPAQRLDITLTPRVTEEKNADGTGRQVWRMGIQMAPRRIVVHDAPFRQIGEHVVGMWKTLGALFHPKSDIGPSKLSGPVGIARGFHAMAQIDWRLLLWFTIMVNVNLALMNLLPVPVLDGGHIVFAALAKLRGRSLPIAFMQKLTTVFMAGLLMMILYVSSYDVRRWLHEARAERAIVSPPPSPLPPAAPGPAAQ